MWQREKRRCSLARHGLKACLKNLTEDELNRMLDYHWAEFVKANPRATGKPADPTAKRNWLTRRAGVGSDGAPERLDPYRRECTDSVRQRCGLPLTSDVRLAREKLVYPKMPSVREEWVNNPVKDVEPHGPHHVYGTSSWK